MSKLVITILFFCVFSVLYAQNTSNPYDKNYAVKYDNEANFEEGIDKLSEILSENIKIQGLNLTETTIAEISIDVMPDGSVGNIIFLENIAYEIQMSIVNTLKLLKFTPATVNGFKIRQNIVLIIPLSSQ